MMMKTLLPMAILAIACLTAGSCAGSTSRGPARPGSERPGPGDFDARTYQQHDPLEFMRIMDRSSIQYKVATADASALGPGTPLNEVQPQASAIHPHTRLVRIDASSLRLTRDDPSGALVPIFEQALRKVGARDFAGAEPLYRQALAKRPDYFLTWTNLGSTLYALGRHDEAIVALLRSITLNDLGYQAYWFLADAYLAKGDKAKALTSITTAYVINRNGHHLQTAVSAHLGQQGLRLRERRLDVPLRLVRKDARSLMIVLPSHGDGMAFLPLASCLAVWTMEPRFASFDARLIKEWGFNPLKWIECLRSQAAVSKATISQGRRLTPQEKYLVDVAEDGLIDALVIWEIAVAQDASWSLRAPPEVRAAMARYLRKYVFEPLPSGGR